MFIFNWRIIDLQYCVDFHQTSAWISHSFTHVPSHLNISPTSLPITPIYLVMEPQVDFPESYSNFPLAIYFTYGNVCFNPIQSERHLNPSGSRLLKYLSHLKLTQHCKSTLIERKKRKSVEILPRLTWLSSILHHMSLGQSQLSPLILYNKE